MMHFHGIEALVQLFHLIRFCMVISEAFLIAILAISTGSHTILLCLVLCSGALDALFSGAEAITGTCGFSWTGKKHQTGGIQIAAISTQ